jgi:preprotein translocase subunit SecG
MMMMMMMTMVMVVVVVVVVVVLLLMMEPRSESPEVCGRDGRAGRGGKQANF